MEQCVLVRIFDEPSCMVCFCHLNVYPFHSTLFVLPHMSLSNSIFRVLYLLMSISLGQKSRPNNLIYRTRDLSTT